MIASFIFPTFYGGKTHISPQKGLPGLQSCCHIIAWGLLICISLNAGLSEKTQNNPIFDSKVYLTPKNAEMSLKAPPTFLLLTVLFKLCFIIFFFFLSFTWIKRRILIKYSLMVLLEFSIIRLLFWLELAKLHYLWCKLHGVKSGGN